MSKVDFIAMTIRFLAKTVGWLVLVAFVALVAVNIYREPLTTLIGLGIGAVGMGAGIAIVWAFERTR